MKKRPDSEPSNAKYPFDLQRIRRRIWPFALALSGLLAVVLSLHMQRPHTLQVPAAPAHYLDDRAELLSPEFVTAKDHI